MSISQFLVFNLVALLWSAVVLWVYYCGSKQINPVQISAVFDPVAKLFKGKPEAEEDETPTIPQSVRRA